MKIRLAIVLLAVMASVPAYGQEVSISSGVYSQFLTDFGATPNTDAVSISGVTVSHKGFRVGGYLIASLGKNIEETPQNEIDLLIAYNRNFDFGGWLGMVNVDAGFFYYDFASPSLWSANGDYVQPFIELRREVVINDQHAITPLVRFEAPIPLTDGTTGSHLYLGLGHSWNVAAGLVFSHNANLVFDDGAYGLDEGMLFLHRASLSWMIRDRFFITPSVKYTAPLMGALERKPEIMFGCNVGLKF